MFTTPLMHFLPTLLLLLLLHPTASRHSPTPLPGCSRLLSREAAASADAFARTARLHSVALLPGCALLSNATRFAAQERAKSHPKPRQWHCALCGRAFSEERWLDAHLHNKHGPGAPELPCLADHCHMLGCPSLEEGGGGGDAAAAADACGEALRSCVPAGEGAFLSARAAEMCHAPFEARAAVRRAAAAVAAAFQWTPQRLVGAAALLAVLAVGLRMSYAEDLKDPIISARERLKREKAAAAAAAAAAAEVAEDAERSAAPRRKAD